MNTINTNRTTAERPDGTSRRAFLEAIGMSAMICVAPNVLADAPLEHKPTLLFNCDLNWARWPKSETHPRGMVRASLPEDWAEVDAQEYFDWHRRFGNNVTYCQAYCSSGYALYPSKLGPVGKGKAATLLPRLYELSRKAGMPFWSYFCVNADVFMAKQHPEWLAPDAKTLDYGHRGLLLPESPRTELLCERIREFLGEFPVDWLLLDWFAYGSLNSNGGVMAPGPFVRKPFQRIIGRPMPAKAEDIAPEEQLRYKRAILAEQFRSLRDAVKGTSPKTRIIFNVPYHKPEEELWVDHPMLRESDGLFAESSDQVVGWLLKVRKPAQRVMTTVIGRGGGLSDPNTWKRWHERGCDFFGYAWGTPPDFRPIAMYEKDLETTRQAFAAMSRSK